MVAIVLFAALHGLRRGVLASFLGVVGLVCAYVAASVWYRSLAAVLVAGVHLPAAWAGTLAYGLLLLTGYVFVGTSVAVLLENRIAAVPARLLGLIVGVAKGALLSAVLLGALLASPLNEPVARDTNRSLLAPYALRLQRDGARSLANVLPHSIHLFGIEDSRF